jgi:hypothetical protein
MSLASSDTNLTIAEVEQQKKEREKRTEKKLSEKVTWFFRPEYVRLSISAWTMVPPSDEYDEEDELTEASKKWFEATEHPINLHLAELKIGIPCWREEEEEGKKSDMIAARTIAPQNVLQDAKGYIDPYVSVGLDPDRPLAPTSKSIPAWSVSLFLSFSLSIPSLPQQKKKKILCFPPP